MRLSTERDRDDARSVAVLHAAWDAGVTLLDTADAYCLDDSERGHNERLVARALAAWGGDRSQVTVATKGGMTRPNGRWEPDGRAKHLRAACEASCEALGVERIALYQLHAPDPRTPLATSVRGLAALEREGLIEAIGLSNVTVRQIEEARRITDIAGVQIELSLWRDEHFLSGVAAYCIAQGILVLAHRPLGGPRSRSRTANDPTLRDIAAKHDATPSEIALAWLYDLSDAIVPLPGATRVETASSSARARLVRLTDEDRVRLDAMCPAARAIRPDARPRAVAQARVDAEIVLVMGLPGAGKTTIAREFVARGYARVNRDEAGGTLRQLLPAIDSALAAGSSRIVLDNTYGSRASRAPVIQLARDRGVAVRCVWLSTSIDDAQVNAVTRLLARHGTLLGEDELARRSRHDVSAFPPTVQFRYQRELEPPDVSEGLSRVDVVTFERRIDPTYTNRAVIVWCDGHNLTAMRASTLRCYEEDGYRILGMSWQPAVAEGARTAEDVATMFKRMNEETGLSVEVEYCPHAAGPPRCWCRKPLPGLGVLFIERYRLNPSECVYVGDGPQDPGFARKLGFQYQTAESFFGR